jgi:SIR2-like domain
MDQELVEAVRAHEAVLFVGAGVSAGLGLPGFEGLVDELAAELGYDREVFRQLGDYSTLAEYFRLEQGGLGALRSRLDVAWNRSDIDIRSSRVHKLIVALEFPLIYTTNWDRWLEKAHETAGVPHKTIIGVGDLRALQGAVVQIVKFHGDFADDESLVLTESSYMRRMDFSSPLDIKLRADALGRSLVFVGYSLRDPNTRLLLFKIHELWKNTPYGNSQPRSFLITDRPNAVQDRVLKEWGISSIVADDGATQEDRLANLLEQLVLQAHGKTGDV